MYLDKYMYVHVQTSNMNHKSSQYLFSEFNSSFDFTAEQLSTTENSKVYMYFLYTCTCTLENSIQDLDLF